jgi:hypothetical protein
MAPAGSFKMAVGMGAMSFVGEGDREYEQAALLAPDASNANNRCV